MSVFDHPEFDQHECVHFVHDEASGLRAIIAVHNTVRGPALGGCRMWPYASSADALTDVLRLSRGMTYKSAMANIDLGGGKSVIIGDARQMKSDALVRAMGRAVDRLGGLYIAAEDSGTSVEDLRRMGEVTAHVGGVIERPGPGGEPHSGDPSPATALGVFHGLAAAVRFQLQRDDLEGVRVAIQGVGNVGYRLAGHLHAAGAKLVVADIHQPNIDRVVEAYGADVVPVAEIDAQEETLRAIIESAIEVHKAGRKVDFKAKRELVYPEELNEKMAQDAGFKAAFEGLTPGRQRGYILHISDAKQSKTRTARIEKHYDRIMDGMGIHDR